MKRLKGFIAALLALILFLSFSAFSGKLLMPKRVIYGCTWDSFCQEKRDSIDVMFFGSSLAYCDIIPAVIWEKTGITTYVMAGPTQTMPISYYYIKQACKTQSPKVIYLESTGVFYKQYEEYTKANIGYMPWSVNRIKATVEASSKDDMFGLLFPPYSYHYRWFQVSKDEVLDKLAPKADMLAGYTLLTEHTPQGKTEFRDFTPDEENYKKNLEYIGKICAFCKDNGIELRMYTAPAKGVIPEDMFNRFKSDLDSMYGMTLTDFNDFMEQLNINDQTDWFDRFHFNLLGAEKFSALMADQLAQSVTPEHQDDIDTALWQQRADYIEQQRIQMS